MYCSAELILNVIYPSWPGSNGSIIDVLLINANFVSYSVIREVSTPGVDNTNQYCQAFVISSFLASQL